MILRLLPFLLPAVLGSRILVYNPLFAQSHVNFMSTVARILTEEGHHVVRLETHLSRVQTVLAPIVNPSIHFDPSTVSDTKFVTLPSDVVAALNASFKVSDLWTSSSNSPQHFYQVPPSLPFNSLR